MYSIQDTLYFWDTYTHTIYKEHCQGDKALKESAYRGLATNLKIFSKIQHYGTAGKRLPNVQNGPLYNIFQFLTSWSLNLLHEHISQGRCFLRHE